MTDSCATCFYGRSSVDGLSVLQCRRYSPTGSNVREDRAGAGLGWIAIWPSVRDEDWCGEFKEKANG